MTPSLIVVVAVFPFVLLASAAFLFFRQRSMLKAAVLGMTAIHEFVLVVFPCLYSVGDGFELERQIYYTPEQLLSVLLLEGTFVFFFILPLMIGSRRKRPQTTGMARTTGEMAIIYILMGGVLLSYICQLASPGFSYEALAASSDVVVKTGLGASLIDWMDTFIRWPGIITAALVLMSENRRTWLRLLGGLVLILGVYIAVINGVRGGILLLIELALVCAFLRRSTGLLLMASACTLAVAPLMSWVHNVMRYETATAADAGVSRGEMFFVVLRQFQELGYGGLAQEDSRSFLKSWADRAEGPRNSIGLRMLQDNGEGAGPRPILSALIMPIPRIWWPDKPLGGSTDSTNLGAAIYRVQQLKPNTAPTDMGPLLASAHAYWEGGWVWVLGGGLLTGLFWRAILGWAEMNHGILGEIVTLCFMAALPIDGLFTALNPLYTFVLIAYRLVPLFLLAWILRIRMTGPERRPKVASKAEDLPLAFGR